MYYPPPIAPVQRIDSFNKNFATASSSPISELSSPLTNRPPPPIYQLEENPPKRNRICGLPVWLLIVLVLLLATVGGVVGGLLGTRAHSSSSSKKSESPNTPNSNATTPSANETSILTPKFASIATAKAYNETYLQVFYLESTSLKASVFDGGSWNDLGDLSPSIDPRLESPLAAVSWVLSGDIQVQVPTSFLLA